MTDKPKPDKPPVPGNSGAKVPFVALGFTGFLALILTLTMVLSSTGMMLNGPNDKDQISLRSVSNRRTHFFTHYWAGK